MARKSRGRQRVPMTKISNEANLQVTFSKRRYGLFKKASELCILCGIQIALMVFTPSKKVFCFGHPCFETLIDRFEGRLSLNQHAMGSDMQQMIEAFRNVTLNELTNDLTRVLGLIDNEKKLGNRMTQAMKASMVENWWEHPVGDIETDKLEILRPCLEELKCKTSDAAKGRMLVGQALNATNNNNFFFGSTSSTVVDGPSSNQGLVNSNVNNAGFNIFSGNGHAMQAPTDQASTSTAVFNNNSLGWHLNAWNPNFGGGFL